MKIGAVIPFTCDDKIFIKPLISNLLPICNNIVLTYSDTYLSGTMQNSIELNNTINIIKSFQNENASCTIKLLKYDIERNIMKDNIDGPYFVTWKRYWICLARKLGVMEICNKSDWILLLDSDEIVDTSNFQKWITTELPNVNNEVQVINFDNYVYYYKAIYRSNQLENSIVMIKPDIMLNYEHLAINEWERTAFIKFTLDNMILKNVKLNNDIVMFHHYSWVRSKQNLISKIKNWGHSDDHATIILLLNDRNSKYTWVNDKYFKFHDIEDNQKIVMAQKSLMNYQISYYYGAQDILIKHSINNFFKNWHLIEKVANLFNNTDKFWVKYPQNDLLDKAIYFINNPTFENFKKLPICSQELIEVKNIYNIECYL